MGTIFSKACDGLRAQNWPIAVSKKKVGMPTKKSMMKKGIKNGAPPCLNTKYGNLHTFPSIF
jgi:hypothetical protein